MHTACGGWSDAAIGGVSVLQWVVIVYGVRGAGTDHYEGAHLSLVQFAVVVPVPADHDEGATEA